MKTMKIAGVFLWTLSVLSMAEAVRSGICLNGGSSVPSLSSGEHMFCLCADGFEGRRCEKVKGPQCYIGIGLSYRGSMSKSESGQTCEVWDLDTRGKHMSSDVHGGRHNYCRNLLYRERPWCYVRRNQQLVWEYCDVPHCALNPGRFENKNYPRS
ncbi:hypothetical protein INR49_003232 [Caranx melampygus]|nr:hypothetical protein INR49_003232 [Caranx melampygus]